MAARNCWRGFSGRHESCLFGTRPPTQHSTVASEVSVGEADLLHSCFIKQNIQKNPASIPSFPLFLSYTPPFLSQAPFTVSASEADLLPSRCIEYNIKGNPLPFPTPHHTPHAPFPHSPPSTPFHPPFHLPQPPPSLLIPLSLTPPPPPSSPPPPQTPHSSPIPIPTTAHAHLNRKGSRCVNPRSCHRG